MRRIVGWVTATVAVVVLLFTYRTSTSGPAGGDTAQVTGATTAAGGTSGGDGDTTTSGTGTASGSSPSGTGSGSGSGTSGDSTGDGGASTFDGSVQQTRYGPVQVRIAVSGGRLVDVTVLQVPDSDRHDKQINGYAVPILRQAALDAQSADIDAVSGATITSTAYRRSLQAALDAAHLG